MTYCIIMLGDCALRLEKGGKTAHIRGPGGKFLPAGSHYYTAFCGACKGGRGAFRRQFQKRNKKEYFDG